MAEKILEVEHLTIRYKDAKEPVIKDFSFCLEKGEILCIGGRSGAGKSTIVWALMEMLEDYNAIAEGIIRLNGKEIIYNGKKCGERSFDWSEIALVPQASMSGFNPLFTIGKTLMEMLNLYEGKGYRKEKEKRIYELLEMVNLEPSVYYAYPHELSGGMKQRAAIAMGIMFHPQVLILDEATTGLDLLIQAQVLGTILRLKETQDISILFISHDRELADHFCNRRIEL
jgi:peptide/nickel transport system ATP-binding protein